METHHITPARGLSETGLKWIALVTMVLDHIHYFFSFTGCVPEWFSMVGRLGAPLFLFCLVEGFTHTHSRKRYFARVYVLSTAMSLLFFFMAFAHVLVRPDGFYPANGMMTTFVILMVMFQGIDWLGRRHIVRGLAALLLPLAWPFLASALSLAVPALATPVGLAAYSVLPAWGTTGDSSWPVLAMGLVLYLFRRNRRGQVLAFAVGVTPVVAKTSTGAVEHIPIARVTNLSQTLDKLKEAGFWVFGTDMDGTASHKWNTAGKLALIIGNEGKGISANIKKQVDEMITIPMGGHVQSLNASVAAAVLMYEVYRNRL